MYESFYRFTEKPFHLSPNPRFFFESPGHKRAMSYLRYGLTQNEGFIVISGGIGTGKTTLVRILFEQLAAENVVAAQLVTTHLEKDDLLRMIAASFGLAHEGNSKAAILKNLETFLIARAKEGKKALLVIDEAQNLPIESLEELRMLSNFQLGDRVLLQTFLLGQNEFRDTLKSDKLEQLRQRIIAAYHLESLTDSETTGYIKHRMSQVGWKSDPYFTDQAYAAIFKHTDGVPRRINNFCDRLLLFGYLEELHTIDAQQVKEVATELKQEVPLEKAREEQPVDPPIPTAAAHIGISLPQETAQLNGLEQRTHIVEERIDILERAFRRQLETRR